MSSKKRRNVPSNSQILKLLDEGLSDFPSESEDSFSESEISLDLHLSESEEENESQYMKNDTCEKQSIVEVLDEFVENNPVCPTVKDNGVVGDYYKHPVKDEIYSSDGNISDSCHHDTDKLPTHSPSQSPVTQSEKEAVDDIGNSL